MKKAYTFYQTLWFKSMALEVSLPWQREKTLSIGLYPDVGLSEARNVRDNARKKLADKIDPGLAKQCPKRSAKEASENSFEIVAREWFIKRSPYLVTKPWRENLTPIRKRYFSWLGNAIFSENAAPNY